MDGFAITMKRIFQMQGQTVVEFMNELKSLTPEDKKWYHAELNKSGFECSEPGVV